MFIYDSTGETGGGVKNHNWWHTYCCSI